MLLHPIFVKMLIQLLKKSNVVKVDIDKLDKVPNDLSSLKSNVDELYIGKLKTTPVDLSELRHVVKK